MRRIMLPTSSLSSLVPALPGLPTQRHTDRIAEKVADRNEAGAILAGPLARPIPRAPGGAPCAAAPQSGRR
jgi:hypothetical protein